MSAMGEDRTPEQWAEATKPGTWLLEKGEKVVIRPSNPEHKARLEALAQTLRDTLGDNHRG